MKPMFTPLLFIGFSWFWILPEPEQFSFVHATNTIACNDSIYVSMDANCQALLHPDDLVEGFVGDPADYSILIHSGPNLVPNPIPADYLWETLVATVTFDPTGNSCWSFVLPQDKTGPVINCPADTITINCWVALDQVPAPEAYDNCSTATLSLVNTMLIDTDICDNNEVLSVKRWIAFDDADNQSGTSCDQYIRQVRPTNIDFPNDIIWSCTQYADHPQLIYPTPLAPDIAQLEDGIEVIDATGVQDSQVLSTSGSGNPGPLGVQSCFYNISHSDQIIQNCGSNFDIIRTWTILDWCTNDVITSNNEGEDKVQTIKIMDVSPPEIISQSSLPIPVDSSTACFSLAALPIPTVLEDCSSYFLQIFTPSGEADYVNGQDASGGATIPAPGLAPGNHTITYVATNACGLSSEVNLDIIVYDPIAPVALCDVITEINLDSDGSAVAVAEVFNDGSYDNCCLDEFQVRRMVDNCNQANLQLGPSVSFCCEDVGTGPIQIVFRTWDCYENYNECMVQVSVHDKLPPSLDTCPLGLTITCDIWDSQLQLPLSLNDYSILDQFGTASFHDNCSLTVSQSVNYQVNVCGYGQISRTWTAQDDAGNTPAFCNQIIQVNHVSEWGVSFPPDQIGQCTDSELPDFGEPVIFQEDCELIGISYEDQLFNIVPDACYKIIRTWTAINWCIFENYGTDAFVEYSELEAGVDFDQDGDQDNQTFFDGINTGTEPDGYIVFKQIIKVVDTEAPELSIEDQFFCITGTDCGIDIALPGPDVLDCSLEYDINYFTDIPNDLGGGSFEEVTPGNYTVLYEVWDACGNVNYIEQAVEVVDCKLPTPVCLNTISVTIMQNGEIVIPAEIFDAGSYDNCEGPLYFSYSANVSDSLLWLNCDYLGQINIEIWVTDQYGNQDFCETYFFLYDNAGNSCVAQPIVAGLVYTSSDLAMPMADILVNTTLATGTDVDGYYAMSLDFGQDYSVSPLFEDDPLNGVTTFDQVLISKHILGIQPIQDPYQHIAADANGSGTVTTSDIVELRKLILGLSTGFPNLESWRFIDAYYVFPNPLNPWEEPFPEVLNFNNLSEDVLDADFIGIKVGDVNSSATL
ncbi:MAG: hypothetical protein KDC34_09675 [Saprospiraceae bacterium]|nr:hypothetical protein [Saprospiraceae bacterium]